jgi:hypothetical protein
MSTPGRDPAARSNESEIQGGVGEALALMEQALVVLDASQGPADVGAHLDLAIHRLKDWLGLAAP